MSDRRTFLFKVPFFEFSEKYSSDFRNPETFFDVEHDDHNEVRPNELDTTVNKEVHGEEKFYSVSPQGLRRSMSTGNLNLKTNTENDYLNGIESNMKNLRICTPIRQQDYDYGSIKRQVKKLGLFAQTLSNRKSMSRDALNKIAGHQITDRYVSMAEAINQFHKKTPTRFHSQSKTRVSHIIKTNATPALTIAHSPVLKTKLRMRSTTVPSQEEREAKEFEEARKHRIKANPVNAKILKAAAPLKTNEKKSPTKPEPFNLSSAPVRKVVPNSPRRLTEFHAKPVPKSVLEPPQPIIRTSVYTIPRTPKFMKNSTVSKSNELVTEPKPKVAETTKLTITKTKPFSFEERDKELFKKRDQLLMQALLEEQKLREFHAKPVPKKISQMALGKMNQTVATANDLLVENMFKIPEQVPNTFSFKARPASVVHKKPFQPKKEERTLVEITGFKLNTELRAKERNEYEKKKKVIEEDRIHQMQQAAHAKLLKEQIEIAQLRKDTEIKANPIRRYKEVPAVTTKKLTLPKSPKFISDRNKNKENGEVN